MKHVAGRTVAGGAVLALVVGLCAVVTGGSVTATADAAGAPVLARHGNLTERPTGMPAPGIDPALQLRSATVRQDLTKGTVAGTFVLRASPPSSESAEGAHGVLSVNFGTYDDDRVCVADTPAGRSEVALAGDLAGTGFSRSGATYTLSRSVAEARWASWDCAYALVLIGDSPQDVLGGSLAETRGKPALRVKSVRLLGSATKPLRLVPGLWTPVEVEIVNPGTADAAGVVVRGNGKGLQVRRTRVGAVAAGQHSTTATVRVRLQGKRKQSVLRLQVVANGAKAVRRIRVQRFVPRKPIAGRYVNRKKGISFRVRNGRVVEFRGTIQSQCGTWPQFTYNTQQWRFPRARIRKDGIVLRTVRTKNRRLDLRMRIVGGRATQGRFYYTSPAGYCHGSTFFNARRIGR